MRFNLFSKLLCDHVTEPYIPYTLVYNTMPVLSVNPYSYVISMTCIIARLPAHSVFIRCGPDWAHSSTGTEVFYSQTHKSHRSFMYTWSTWLEFRYHWTSIVYILQHCFTSVALWWDKHSWLGFVQFWALCCYGDVVSVYSIWFALGEKGTKSICAQMKVLNFSQSQHKCLFYLPNPAKSFDVLNNKSFFAERSKWMQTFCSYLL